MDTQKIPDSHARLDKKTERKVICGRRWVSMNDESCDGAIARIEQFDARVFQHLAKYIGFKPVVGETYSDPVVVRVVRFDQGWRAEKGVWGPSKRAARKTAAGHPPTFSSAPAKLPHAGHMPLYPSPQWYPCQAVCPICHAAQVLDADVLKVVVVPDREQPGQQWKDPRVLE
jgi:hypothetical protein